MNTILKCASIDSVFSKLSVLSRHNTGSSPKVGVIFNDSHISVKSINNIKKRTEGEMDE